MLGRQHVWPFVRNLTLVLLITVLASTTGCAAASRYKEAVRDAVGPAMPGDDVARQDLAGAPIAEDVAGEVEGAEGSGAKGAPTPTLISEERLIVRDATVRLEVRAVRDAIDAIERTAGQHGGTVTSMQVGSDTEGPVYRYDESTGVQSSTPMRGWVTVRVPADRYDAFMGAVTQLGTVRFRTQAAEDVTQQHVDMQARLDNLRAEEKRLREFFAAAKKVDEMLAIERELERVRGEIESLDAQIRYLERQAAMATVTIELVEPKDVIRPAGETWGFGDAVTAGFRAAAAGIQLVIVILIAVSPFLALGAIAYVVIRAIVRKRRVRVEA